LDLPRGVDLRILEDRAGLDALQYDLAIAMQARRVDAFASGKVIGKFPLSLAELTGGANRIAALGVIQADREVDEGLQEKAARTTFRGPDFFPNFVALEEAASIEEVNPAIEQFVHDAT
jgi:hypothetical protein